jgi:hypothetical protein
MKPYTDPLWGYRLVIPDHWTHKLSGDVAAFAANLETLDSEYTGLNAGHLLVRGEFNHTGENLSPLWASHITKISLMAGAKDLGSAPFELGGGTGFEAEIVLPKTKNQRLWTGLLSYGWTILHLMVSHPLDQRESFQPVVNQILTSLRFLTHYKTIDLTPESIPLPPETIPADPSEIIPDIKKPQNWYAYFSQASIAPLQSFYLRELTYLGWEIEEFVPYPNQTSINFARLRIGKASHNVMLGIMPLVDSAFPSAVVIKYTID